MKQSWLLGLLFFQLAAVAQTRPVPPTDCNTLFVCIDSVSYSSLFTNKFVKDTLFFCKEAHQETGTGAYTGKYWIGESATIEFLQPNNNNHTGDHRGDWGIEFKTRQLHALDQLSASLKALHIAADTSTTIITDSLPIPWYKSIGFTTPAYELTTLEYQREYLESTGFTKSQVNKPMTYKEFNGIISGGRKYPRQFAMLTYIRLYADKKLLANLVNFGKLNHLKKIGNSFTNGTTTIAYQTVDHLPPFPLQEMGISLLTNQGVRNETISDNLFLKVNGKKASIVFGPHK